MADSLQYLLARSDGIAVGLSLTSKLIVAVVLLVSLAVTGWIVAHRPKPSQEDKPAPKNRLN